ncbi:SpoIIE family protein phosphatase [Kineococcus sp. SYSU DK003]|uniref:SpoIIE family protein phosphatase n=1 Tax=Kineococcus sp. SYSU DK003 TaxID=3383124 RepID=UPI003D7F120D
MTSTHEDTVPAAGATFDRARFPAGFHPDPHLSLPGWTPTTEPEVVGRDVEVAELRRLLRSARQHGQAVLLQGEAGLGKSTLVAGLQRFARREPVRVLRCTGTEADATGGFTGLHELLHPLLDDVEALPARQRSALLTAFGREDGPTPDRLLIGLAALGLLEEAAALSPLLVVVEDLHWLDAASADVVNFVARRLSTSPILLVATARTSPGGQAPASGAPWRVLPLRPLATADAEALLAQTAGTLRPALRARILREAGGNPLALRELAAAVLAGGTDHLPAPAQTLPTTQRLEQAFLAEVDRLPTASRRLLLLAAADGDDLPLTRLAAASGQPDRVVPDLDPVERADLVSVVDGHVRFRHPLVRSAVYGGASMPDRAAAHRALAAVAGDAGRAVWHLAAGTHTADEEVAAALEATAHRAVLHGAPEEAFAALERAAALSPDVPERARRLAAAAEVARRAGLALEAVRALDAALPLAQDPVVVTRLAVTESVLGAVQGHPGRGPADLVSLSEGLGGPDGTAAVPERLRMLTRAAVQANGFGLPFAVRARIEAAVSALDVPPGHPLQDLALAALDPDRHGHRVRGRFAALARHALTQEPDSVTQLAHVAEVVHDLQGAETTWEVAARAAHEAGAPGDEAHALIGRGGLRVLRGRLDEAVADLQLGIRTAFDAGQPLQAAYGEALLARAHAWRGEHVAALAAVERSVELAGGTNLAITVALRRWAQGLVALDQQRPDDAWHLLQGVTVHTATAALALGDVVEAAVRVGDPAAAATASELLEQVDRTAQQLQVPHLLGLVHRARALMHAAAGREQDAEREFTAAAVHGAAGGPAGGVPLELARTRLLHGEFLRRQRRILDARELLAPALAAFTAAGARGLAQRATAELRAAGVAPGATAGDRENPAQSLTPQELQIAQLAASGMTNKEIADKIYLSHRTVAAHLYKVFPKLGITHRAQLRDALSAPPEPVAAQNVTPLPITASTVVTIESTAPTAPLLTRLAEAMATAVSADEVASAATRLLVGELEPTLASVVLRGSRPRVLRHWSVRGGGVDVSPNGWRTASLAHESPSLDPARAGRGDFHEDLSAFSTRCALVQGVVASAGLRALADLPLVVADRVVGFVVLGWDTERELPPDLRQTLEEFAATTAAALDRCLAVARGRSLVRSLQAVVPLELPPTPWMRLAGRRQVAGLGSGVGGFRDDVGGDWYDALSTEDGASVLVVGDVTGHGPAVAAASVQMRGVLGSHALEQPSPAEALRRLDRAVERLSLPAGATVVVLRITPHEGGFRITWSNAGHPVPLVRLPDGRVHPLRSAPELPVGVDAAADRRDHVADLPDGSTLLLFTDGLLENRLTDVGAAAETLRSEVQDLPATTPEGLVDRLLERVSGVVDEDDVTILAALLCAVPASTSMPAPSAPSAAGVAVVG